MSGTRTTSEFVDRNRSRSGNRPRGRAPYLSFGLLAFSLLVHKVVTAGFRARTSVGDITYAGRVLRFRFDLETSTKQVDRVLSITESVSSGVTAVAPPASEGLSCHSGDQCLQGLAQRYRTMQMPKMPLSALAPVHLNASASAPGGENRLSWLRRTIASTRLSAYSRASAISVEMSIVGPQLRMDQRRNLRM